MCGRFLLRCAPESWPESLLGTADQPLLPTLQSTSELDPILLQPRSNISPTQAVFAVVESDQSADRMLKPLGWGLVPSWADDKKIGASMINARSETVDEKRSFKKLFERHRCLIPADGYYEWVTEGKKKQPYLIERPDHSLFCFAGLWERNQLLNLETCTIITTAATPNMSWLHDRMPVVVDPKHYDAWLSTEFRDIATLKSWLQPEADGTFVTAPVDKVSGI